MLLPQLLCGIASSAILYSFMYRKFGVLSGLLAGIVYNTTPVVLATNRNTTMDSSLNLVLLLAAWVFVLASEKKKFLFFTLGTALIGIGFNVKMYKPIYLFRYLLILFFEC